MNYLVLQPAAGYHFMSYVLFYSLLQVPHHVPLTVLQPAVVSHIMSYLQCYSLLQGVTSSGMRCVVCDV